MFAGATHEMRTRIAYMPLTTYPETISDESVMAAVGFVASLRCELHVTTFAVRIPQMYSPFGSLLVDVAGLVRNAEEMSKTDCRRLQDLVLGASKSHFMVECKTRDIVLGAALDAAASEARHFDLSVLPWSGATIAVQDMTEALVFGSGRAAILVPPSAKPATIDHIAIAWDASHVAARALGDALPLLAVGGRISVLTVQDEKPLSGTDIAESLAAMLKKRGFSAEPLRVSLDGRIISEALQESALRDGAQMLAMGGFGHSRVRDFILGGATKGVLTQLRLPVLLSH
jgi:nucleotide-binding universal stress UspA family protein